MLARASAVLLVALLAFHSGTAPAAQTYARANDPAARSPIVMAFESSRERLSPIARCRIEFLQSKMRDGLRPAPISPTADSLVSANVDGRRGDDTLALAFVVLMDATNAQAKELAPISEPSKNEIVARHNVRATLVKIYAAAARKASLRAAGAAFLERTSLTLPPGPCIPVS